MTAPTAIDSAGGETPAGGRALHTFSICVIAFGLLSLAAAIVTSLQIPAVPIAFLSIFWVVYGLAFVLLLIATWRRATSKKTLATIVAGVLALVLSVINVLIVSISRESKDTINGLAQSADEAPEFVLLSSSAKDSASDGESSIGVLSADQDQFDLSSAFTEAFRSPDAQFETNSFSLVPRDSLTGLVSGIKDDSLDAAAMQKGAYDALVASLPEFEKDLVVVDTFPIPMLPTNPRESSTPPSTASAEPDLIDEPGLVYISGIDNDGDISESGRSDVNILAAINPTSREILMVNTPRDYYVPLADIEGSEAIPDKLTHAGIYGIDTARLTMEELYGVDIPYQVRVNFLTLLELIDIIGPIEVYTPTDVGRFEAGQHTLDSEAALEFSRVRHGLEGGDRARGENQILVLESIVNKLASTRNPEKLLRIVDHVSGSVETNMSPETIRDFAINQARERQPWEIERFSVDGTDATRETYSMPGYPLYVMIPDEESLDEARELTQEAIASE